MIAKTTNLNANFRDGNYGIHSRGTNKSNENVEEIEPRVENKIGPTFQEVEDIDINQLNKKLETLEVKENNLSFKSEANPGCNISLVQGHEVDPRVLEIGLKIFNFGIKHARSTDHFFPTALKCFLGDYDEPLTLKLEESVKEIKNCGDKAELGARSQELFDWLNQELFQKLEILDEAPDSMLSTVDELSHVSKEGSLTWIRISESSEKKPVDSHLAFHGSPIGNWFNIIRTGLKVMSGTQYQAHGSARGPGIYSTGNVSTALSYSKINLRDAVIFGVIETPFEVDRDRHEVVLSKSDQQRLCYVVLLERKT